MAFRDDLISALALPLGRPKAISVVDQAEGYIREQARIGAVNGVNDAARSAASKYKPYLIGGGILFGATFFMSLVAFSRSFKKRK